MLTDVEWLVVYVDYSISNEQTFDDETNIYSFGRDTSRVDCDRLPERSESIKKRCRDTSNGLSPRRITLCIYMAGNSTDGYWMIGETDT